MPLDLPSLRSFRPHFHSGQAERFYLPLLFDLMAVRKPRLAVVLGFGEGDLFFALCQSAVENQIDGRCVAVRRSSAEEKAEDDEVWMRGAADGAEFFGEVAQFLAGSATKIAGSFANESIDLLLINDCDSCEISAPEFAAWRPRLSSGAVVLVHGIDLERENGLRRFWQEISADHTAVEFHEGVGLGLMAMAAPVNDPFLAELFDSPKSFTQLYHLAAERSDAQARAGAAAREVSSLRTRQVWIDTLLEDRWKTQEIMDRQAEIMAQRERDLATLNERFDELHRDRVKAQLIMDTQADQLKQWVANCEKLTAERNKLKTRAKEQQRMLEAAKRNCRKGGRCFRVKGKADEKSAPKLSIPRKVLREIRRIPGSLFRAWSSPPPAERLPEITSKPQADPYAVWIAAHEPDEEALAEQRRAAAQLLVRPKISLLVPVYHPPPDFLEEMFASVAAQTYADWELCVVEAGPQNAQTTEIIDRWTQRESRIRHERLEQNLGIAENTNRALVLATGDFVGLLDHDDLLAPFALYEMARALAAAPAADLFYSDEDRWSADGRRHSPFFKPEWSPELLMSFMYIGHLTVYRRALVDELRGFRKEFDLSQDYDLALRASERAREIRHVPHVLYHWREHAASGSLGGKPDARKSNLAALADAMRRRNLPADIIELPTANRARLQLGHDPHVSIVIPTDSPERAEACLRKLPAATCYTKYEIVLVTNSGLIKKLAAESIGGVSVQLIPFDAPFNFSAKCNAGARAATGELLVFFNDDVEPQQADWIENLIEPLGNPEVGAVSPKLLYEGGQIQHAGLVTGVRGLVGTAFHQQPQTSTMHFNFAQSLRDVSALSGACLALRRAQFLEGAGFDETNAPISHSDVDLCFRIRERGRRCVYTPFTVLKHVGHVSLGEGEKVATAPAKDKSDIFLLRRWGGFTAHDPYFPDNMRDWLFADSPTPIRMFARNDAAPASRSLDVLFVTHDLTWSGAPILLLHLATWCRQNGIFAVVMAPEDGPLREKYEAAGIPLIIDPLALREHESFRKFCRNFDCLVANTIQSWPAVRSARQENLPVLWWLHETLVGEHFLREDAQLRATLPLADVVFTPSERTSAVYRPFRDRPVVRVPYGIPDLAPLRNREDNAARPLRFLVLGSLEPRKGQDVFVAALRQLEPALRQRAHFEIAGRTMDPEFRTKLDTASQGLENLTFTGALGHAEALDLLARCDVLVCSSRDEAMPVTILEAMSLGKAIVSTTVGGVPEFIVENENGLLVRPENPEQLARALHRLIDDSALAARLGATAHTTYEKYFTIERFGADFRALAEQTIRDAESIAGFRRMAATTVGK
jgi:glycosyltransferase involved in cell wall biosynthesis/GT2 family glycosyltransferase